MKKIDNYTNQYSLSKTLRFSLIPVGKTEENFNNTLLLEKDKERAQKYDKVKKYIDRYHKYFINEVLCGLQLEEIGEYADLYFKPNKTEKDIKAMENLEIKLRKNIASSFSKDDRFNSLFKKEMIEQILPSFLTSEEEKDDVRTFYGFTTYFTTGLLENRKNMYSPEAQTTAISYRCINENLPKFLDNIKKFNIIKEVIPSDMMNKLDETVYDSTGFYVEDIFCVDYYNFVLTQSGIDKYNNVIGGHFDENGVKIQGLNEYINLFNQQVAKENKSIKLPLFTPLYKQILSDRDAISFIPEKFSEDNDLIVAINNFHIKVLSKRLNEVKELFDGISFYNFDGIFVTSSGVNELSNEVFGCWDAVSEGWHQEYKNSFPLKKNKNPEKYEEDMRKAYKKKLSFSITETKRLGKKFQTDDCIGDIEKYLQNTITDKINLINESYTEAESLLTSDYKENHSQKLIKNPKAKELLKNYLDSVKALEHFLKLLKGTGKEDNRDFSFYGKFTECYEDVTKVDALYDKTRNYLTQKPYSNNKIKLNFDNPQFLDGWSISKEIDRSAQLFKYGDNEYYLGVIEKKYNSIFKDKYQSPVEESDVVFKICYEQVSSAGKNIPNLLFVNGKIQKVNGRKDSDGVNRRLEKAKNENLPNDVNRIRLRCGYGVNLNNSTREEVTKFIEYYMNATNKYYSNFKFSFKDPSEYNSFMEFVADVDEQSYQINYQAISRKQLYDYVDKGYLYLFKIYNKDFSKHSKGKPNLHTMYFKMLFDERNLANVVYQLNGGAEMFYREASIKEDERVIHYAKQKLKNKNDDNPNKYSKFKYDLIKDKRFTKRQFSLHLPITLNFKATGNSYINNDVRLALKNSEKNYVIGVDRGERNLLYICVIDEKGNIVEQKSLNEIVSDNGYKVDYHKLLDSKEKKRDSARKDWGVIENIKELKEGYLSQVVHQICEYVIKYDAIIALENLNFGFKKGRFKVEKQVYQKFENSLCSKLNYLVKKDENPKKPENPEKPGGLLNAYQLTNDPKINTNGRQNGIIFYVPAWLTSKIDPVTGFVDLLKPKYMSVNASLDFIEKINDIRFNQEENLFEFEIDYSKFQKTSASYRKNWTVCSNGERIINIRNKEKNNMWDSITIVLTDEFKRLFAEYGIDISKNIKEEILKITSSEFHKRFMKLLSYTMQLRNSMTGNVDVDYLLSPVKDQNGEFFDSRNDNSSLPKNADANGAYNIARKALWAISVLKNTDDDLLGKADLSIKNPDWLEYVQK